MKKKYFFFLSLILAFCSCNKTETSNIHPDVDVYIIGDGTINTVPPSGVARYWKNNKPVDLPSSTVGFPNVSESANGFAIAGNDIYICGNGSTGPNGISGNNYVAKYWKNGVSVNLTSGKTKAFATGISVSGSDVYVSGTESTPNYWYNVPKYWKNGEEKLLADTPNYQHRFYPLSIAVSETDLYLAGYNIDTVSHHNVAAYWKNGVVIPLSDGSADAQATSILLSGTDIYVAGKDGDRAVYWKNQLPVYLTDGSIQANGQYIAVDGDNVCVAGWIGSTATYWKNGIPVSVGDGISLSGIAVGGANVYVTGNISQQNAPSTPGYWINNVLVPIFDTKNYSSTSGIWVVPH